MGPLFDLIVHVNIPIEIVYSLRKYELGSIYARHCF